MFEPYNPQRKKQHLNVKIRAAAESDVKEIVNISIDREKGDFETISTNIKSQIADKNDSFILAASVNHRIVGFGKAKCFQGATLEFPGWYLSGLIVEPRYRHGNIGTLLTVDRLEKIKQLVAEAYYFANATNKVTIELHKKLGFKLIKEPFVFPEVSFSKSHGQLYRKRFC